MDRKSFARLGRQRMINWTDLSREAKAMNVSFLDSLKDGLLYEERLDGHRERLRRILVKRFGPLSARLNKRIENAEMEDLDLWSERIFDVKTVREIFADKQPA